MLCVSPCNQTGREAAEDSHCGTNPRTSPPDGLSTWLVRAQVAAAWAGAPGLSARSAQQSSSVGVCPRAARAGSAVPSSYTSALPSGPGTASEAQVSEGLCLRTGHTSPRSQATDVVTIRPVVLTASCVSNILFFVFFCRGGQISQISPNCSQTSCSGAAEPAAWEEACSSQPSSGCAPGWAFRPGSVTSRLCFRRCLQCRASSLRQ